MARGNFGVVRLTAARPVDYTVQVKLTLQFPSRKFAPKKLFDFRPRKKNSPATGVTVEW